MVDFLRSTPALVSICSFRHLGVKIWIPFKDSETIPEWARVLIMPLTFLECFTRKNEPTCSDSGFFIYFLDE